MHAYETLSNDSGISWTLFEISWRIIMHENKFTFNFFQLFFTPETIEQKAELNMYLKRIRIRD